jgi:GNAT superfamily N-acetyltransferase
MISGYYTMVRRDGKDIQIRTATEDEVPVFIEWARCEGWNPGVHDGECHYAADPNGWFVAERDGDIVGTLAVTNYDASFSFGGFYIIREDIRGEGTGWKLWNHGIAHAGERNFGGDGVFQMQNKYAENAGLIYAYRNVRWQGRADGHAQPDLVSAQELPFNNLLAYDCHHFPAERSRFLEKWISRDETLALAYLNSDESLGGYGVIRRCFEGHKIGPVFANTPDIAECIIEGLTESIPGEVFFFDTPEPNAAAMTMARDMHMEEVFGTARMYSRHVPVLPLHEIFGVTSFELG